MATTVNPRPADIYIRQIQLAQEFLNENRHADVSRLQCLLRKIIPQEFHADIDRISLHPYTPPVVNINGGQNVIAPNANTVGQHFHGQTAEDGDGRKEADVICTADEIDSIVRKHHNYEWGIKKLQELDADGEKENKLIDEYISEVLDERNVISLIKSPKTETQAFALLEAALSTDHNALIKKLLRTDFVKNCTTSAHKDLVCAAIERVRS